MYSKVDNHSDYFASVFDSTESKVTLGMGFFLIEILGNTLLCAILYHQCVVIDRSRTIINWLNGFSIGIGLLNSFVNTNIFFARSLLGAFPKGVCQSAMLLRKFCFYNVFFALNEAYVLKFLYICRWRNIGALQDDLWVTLFFTINIVLSSFMSIAGHLANNFHETNYYLCLGRDPGLASLEVTIFPKRPKPTFFLSLLTLLTNVVTQVFIVAEKKRLDRTVLPMMKDTSMIKNNQLLGIFKNFLFCFLFALAGLYSSWVNSEENVEKVITGGFPNHLILCNLMFPIIYSVLVPLFVFCGRFQDVKNFAKKILFNRLNL